MNELNLQEVNEAAERSLPDFLRNLEAIVNMDSGSLSKEKVDMVGRHMKGLLEEHGWRVEVRPNSMYGDNLIARIHGTGTARILCIGHMDTVFDDGEAAKRPFHIDGNKAFGPGVSDMKSGLLVPIYMVDVLKKLHADDFGTITFVLNSDEELGSPGSKDIIQEMGRENDIALVFESGWENGDVVAERKGVSDFRVDIKGIPAHAGSDERFNGRSAILERFYKMAKLLEVAAQMPEITINFGRDGGGTRTNVIPEDAFMEFEVRSFDPEKYQEAIERIKEICNTTFVEGTQTNVQQMAYLYPLAQTPKSQVLLETVQRESLRMGRMIKGLRNGGASDANNAAETGIPVIDGLGPIGYYEHGPNEYIEVDSIAPRIRLVASAVHALAERVNRYGSLTEETPEKVAV